MRPCAVRQAYIPGRKARAVFLACGRAHSSALPPTTLTRVGVVGSEHGRVGDDVGGCSLLGVRRIHVDFGIRKFCVSLSKIEHIAISGELTMHL